MFGYFQNAFDTLAAAIGTIVVAGGGLTALAYGLFRLFGERWLNTKFEERLASYKHAQQRELEHLRLEINSLLDRTTKLHQREFEVLPQAWSLFNDAYFQIKGMMGFKSHPDLNRMSDTQLDEFLNGALLADWQKNEIRAAKDKTSRYIDFSGWQDVSASYKAYGEWQIFFLKNGIFMTDEIKKGFFELDRLIKGALIEQEMQKTDRNLKISDMKDFRRMHEEGSSLRDSLEAEVHKRLWNSTKAPS